ncbi:MAG: hypothetical protein AB7H66_07815 [Hyphomonadaceae bacterium]
MQTHPDPATLAALWKRARAMFARAIDTIGAPAAVAARTALSRDDKYGIAGWIARLESIVRKLLFAIAGGLVQERRQRAAQDRRPRFEAIKLASLGLAQGAAYRTPLRARAITTTRAPVDPAQPETWPARFAFAPPADPCAVPESRAPRIRALWGPAPPPAPPPPQRAPRRATESALRYAFRLEALRRVLADPLRYAERLARIFRRLCRRYPGAADRFAIAPERPCVPDPYDPRLIIDAIGAAMFAAPVFAALDTS